MKIGASLGSPVVCRRLPLLRRQWSSTPGAAMACPNEWGKGFARRFREEGDDEKERLGFQSEFLFQKVRIYEIQFGTSHITVQKSDRDPFFLGAAP